MKTRQEVFDEVCAKMKEQGGPATSLHYRCSDGTKCAVGVLIPDDKYDSVWDSNFEGCGIDTISSKFPKVLNAVDFDDVEFLSQLQDAHDGSHDIGAGIDDLLRRFERIALRNNLNPEAAQ